MTTVTVGDSAKGVGPKGPQHVIAEEDVLRAGVYGLLARLLVAPPDADVLAKTSNIDGDDTDFGMALNALAEAAKAASPESADDEYQKLFVGLAAGELLPYGSYYMTGFLHEKPLAKLRDDMARLSIAPAEDVSEPEDHIGALCEMMAGLITGAFGEAAGLETQKQFFETHLVRWAGKFFEDLEGAKSARLYRPVGTLGRLFMAIESTAFDMVSESGMQRPH